MATFFRKKLKKLEKLRELKKLEKLRKLEKLKTIATWIFLLIKVKIWVDLPLFYPYPVHRLLFPLLLQQKTNETRYENNQQKRRYSQQDGVRHHVHHLEC